jgi:hypothetical protein
MSASNLAMIRRRVSMSCPHRRGLDDYAIDFSVNMKIAKMTPTKNFSGADMHAKLSLRLLKTERLRGGFAPR